MKIKNTNWASKMFLFALAALFMASCDDLEDIVIDPLDLDSLSMVYSTLEVTDDNSESITIFASEYIAADSTEFSVLVTFNDTDEDMKRLYITENRLGEGEEPYELVASNSDLEFDIDLKADGSIDLDKGLDETFTFLLTFPIDPDLDDEGTIEYHLWATSGRGDYRNSGKKLTVGVGTIVVQYGVDNPETIIKEYTQTLLAAPLGNGTSNTFLSLLDGETYQINEGEETSAFWDFGYYYGFTGKASLASANNYPELFDHDNDEDTPNLNITDLVEYLSGGIEEELQLNKCHFSLGTDLDFDTVEASDLATIETPTAERINQLAEGNVIEFVDAYQKKGLIEVEDISGTDGSNGSITINIKVQP